MNSEILEPKLWTRARWWSALAVALAAQVALIISLSKKGLVMPRRADHATAFYVAAPTPPGSALAELMSVTDPTLFALPNARGVSGPAWLAQPPLRHQSSDWTEPPQWLALPVAELGSAFERFVNTNTVTPRLAGEKPPPRLTEVAVSPLPLRTNSTAHVEGALAGRELVVPLVVPSITNSDILAETVVQAGVSAEGFVFSPVVVSGSGSKAADQRALELVKSIRFNSLLPVATAESDLKKLTWGTIVFQWHTLESLATDAPPAKAAP